MIPILKDGLHPVVVSMVTVVTDNLNSKNSGIYTAAVKVLDTMIANLGNIYFFLFLPWVSHCVIPVQLLLLHLGVSKPLLGLRSKISE